ncbi:hypothetical protein [Telluria beijingensis]|uniref:hypothetical protein n=1 Tax=Telluria beijingensis TaxID=3068633 RepID=UPI002795A459|nr:hypothetical protein [Massilia sp. REN29]
MSSISQSLPPAFGARHDRFTGVAVTLGVHLALIVAWQLSGKLPPRTDEGSDEAMLWLSLPAPAPASTPAPRVETAPAEPARAARPQAAAVPAVRADPVPALMVDDAAAAAPPVAAPSAAEILANARRSVGDIDRALRKENKPLIVAPPDSPQIRMREGMEHARAMAAPGLFEAPKVEELVNNTGDGARRSRVITGRGTYCITERAPTTGIEMIEMHGKQRFTTCPKHETPPKRQVWRTARD